MSRWWLCLIGRHDWTEFGDCRRDPLHVRTYPGEMFVGLRHRLDGTDWTDGPWSRVAKSRHDAEREAGLALEGQLRALGAEVTLMMCQDVARDPLCAAALLDVVRERNLRSAALLTEGVSSGQHG